MLKEYKNYLEVYDRSPQTIKSYLSTVENFYIYLSHNQKTPEIATSADIIGFFTDYFSDNSGKSKNQKLAALKNYYKFLMINDQVTKDPCLAINRFSEPVRVTKALTIEEIQTILQAAEETRNPLRNTSIIATALLCCLRCSELVNLNIDDYDNKELHIIGKGNKERYVPCSDTVCNYLDLYLSGRKNNSTPALFISENNERLSKRSIQALIETLSQKTGIDFHTHTLRHTGASFAYQATNDIVSVQEILGHSNLNTTKHYVHINEESRKRTVDNSALNQVFRK